MYYPNYIFDLYGTLVDIRTKEDSPMLWRRASLWFRQHGADWSGPALWKRYLELCDKEQSKFSDPLAEIELRNVFKALFAEKGVAADERLIEDTAGFFRICSLKKLSLYSWVLPTFNNLRKNGSALYLLSNAQACFTIRELQSVGMLDEFDGIVISSDAGVKKPSPRIMELLLERYHLLPEDCLMIGNDPEADISMAAAVGMDTLYLKTATSPEGILPQIATRILPDENYIKMDELLQRNSPSIS